MYLQSPEDKLTGFYVAAPLQALAFWIFAWTIPPHAKSLSSFFSVATMVPIGFAINEFDHVLIGYIVDAYASDASSACAPLGAIRSILSAVLPLAGLKMFKNLDNNLAVSVLAVVSTLYVGAAIAFFFCGRRLREMSKYHRRHRLEAGLEAVSIKDEITGTGMRCV
jgi:hypothetical protein